jgi:hypothetical protein
MPKGDMFHYPKQAEFNRVLSKTKIYAHAKPGRALKERFVSEIQEIVWIYKLSPETINLPARNGIYEIQIFEIALRTEELSEGVLRAIDKAVPSPIIYQLKFGGRVRFAAAYKRHSEADASKTVIADYFTTNWQPTAKPLPALPVVLDLAALYEEMLRRVLPLARRNGESLAAYVDRAVQLRATERECRDLEARLRRECQFNRKVEINAAIRASKRQLEHLKHSESSP